MTNDILINQMKSLEDACRQLQQCAKDNAKAKELLLCSRSLLTRLLLDFTLGLEYKATALEKYNLLQPDIERLTGSNTVTQQHEILQHLHEVHTLLASLDIPETATLCRKLLSIEADYTASFETSFRAALAEAAPIQDDHATASYDKQALAAFLAESFSAPSLEVASIEMISGGFSKQTLKANLRGPAEVPRTIVLRVDLPKGKAFTHTKVANEFPVLDTLYKRGVKVPRPYAVEPTGDVIGCPFVALACESGKTLGTLFEFPAPIPEIGRQMAQQLARIHTVPEALISRQLGGAQAPAIERITDDIANRYKDWAALGRYSTIMEEGFRVLRQNISQADGRRSLVHGDFGLHNLLVENNQVSAVLDWEFAKLGNPADDLGYAYDTIDHMLGWDAFAAEYTAAGGILPPREQIDFYRLLGLVRITVYCQQADAAFVMGALPGIHYALPGNLYLRGVLIRVSNLLQKIF